MANQDDFLTVSQASSALGRSVADIKKLIRRGELTGSQVGTDWVIPRSSVLEYYASRFERSRLARLRRRQMMKRAAISFIALLIITVFCLYQLTDFIAKPLATLNSVPRAGEWPMFHRDPAHSGNANASSALPQGRLKWVYATGGSIYSSPAVADGTVYFGSRDNKLYALDAATGAKRWEFETGSWVESSPAIANGIVYFGSNDGRLYALDMHTGAKLWDFKASFSIVSSPAVAGGMVYFGSYDYGIYALDAATGRKLWYFKTGDLIMSSPTVANGIVYAGSGDGFFYALDARNGRFRLRFPTPSVHSSPVAIDGIVYFSNISGRLYAIAGDARSWPEEKNIRPWWAMVWAWGYAPRPPDASGFLWRLQVDTITTSSPVVADGILYLASDRKLYSIDINGREKSLVFEAGGSIRSSPAIVGTTLYVGSDDGRLYAVDTTTGKKLWEIITGGEIISSPAVTNATVYIGSHDGKLYAIE
ncbi:MAG: hypothetical protein HW402_798 [Dehalococcoidales bacterium]|nr:hypothetical protein [Dehalococcoidales bacterium]